MVSRLGLKTPVALAEVFIEASLPVLQPLTQEAVDDAGAVDLRVSAAQTARLPLGEVVRFLQDLQPALALLLGEDGGEEV